LSDRNWIVVRVIVGLVVAALILATEDIGALAMSADTCVCALVATNAT
jgi:hypothetical protein